MFSRTYRACVFERKVFKKVGLHPERMDNSICLRGYCIGSHDNAVGAAVRIFAEGVLSKKAEMFLCCS